VLSPNDVASGFRDDIADIAALASHIDGRCLLHAVALDPFGVGAIVDALTEAGISGDDRIVGITQGWKLSGAIKTVERKLADGTFHHRGQKLMSWAVANARVEPRGNAILITKRASGTAKIDSLMAAFNAAALMATNPEVMENLRYSLLSWARIARPTIAVAYPVTPTEAWAEGCTVLGPGSVGV
jgi:phage terminase large subunit-like protein